ncbi:MAG: DUF5717 family protein, partial [Lachnospiraceae bacterium]|nr:DUF5717 family protein [Lachnospiraceae bacterium]
IGKRASMDDFIKLYEVNPREALSVFTAPAFKKLTSNKTEKLYHKLFSMKPVREDNIKEYLIAIQKLYVAEDTSLNTDNADAQDTEEKVLTPEREEYLRQKRAIIKLFKLHREFLNGSVVLGVWAKNTHFIIQNEFARENKDPLLMLWDAYALIKNNENQAAAWLLDEYRRYVRKTAQSEFFYKFIQFITEKEEKIKDKLQEDIRFSYRANSENPLYRFVLYNLLLEIGDEPDVLFKLLLEWSYNSNAYWIYAYAHDLMEKDTSLLRDLKGFYLKAVWSGVKNGKISKKLSSKVGLKAVKQEEYSVLTDCILYAAYNTYKDVELLSNVCAYKISTASFKSKDFEWFKLAIENNVKIMGLYEAYVSCISAPLEVRIPDEILRYFMYANNLSYNKRAVLYVNILGHAAEYGEITEQYKPIILDFIRTEIIKKHIDDNLAYIYDKLLPEIGIDKELSDALSVMLYINRLYCPGIDVARVRIMHESLKGVLDYPIVNHEAYIPIYSGEYAICVEDDKGYRYCLGNNCELQKLFNPGKYLRTCLELSGDKIPYLLHHLNGKTKLLSVDDTNAAYIYTLVNSDIISDEAKSEIGPGFFSYAKDLDDDMLIKKLVTGIDYKKLKASDRGRYIKALVRLSMFDAAYQFLEIYGLTGIDKISISKILSFKLSGDEAPDDNLMIIMAYKCFEEGIRLPAILSFLALNYTGTVRSLTGIYNAAENAGIDVQDLSEKLLLLMMFTGNFTENTEDIFLSYAANGGRDRVVRGYLNMFAYHYYVNDKSLNAKVFNQIEKMVSLRTGVGVNDLLKLALIKKYSSLPAINAAREHFIDDTVSYFLSKDLMFKEMLDLGREYLVKHHLYDECVLEYYASEGNSDVSFYLKNAYGNEEYTPVTPTKLVENVYVYHTTVPPSGGVFWYAVEMGDRSKNISEIHLSFPVCNDIKPLNRFECLSALYKKASDEAYANELMADFEKKNALTERLFKIL